MSLHNVARFHACTVTIISFFEVAAYGRTTEPLAIILVMILRCKCLFHLYIISRSVYVNRICSKHKNRWQEARIPIRYTPSEQAFTKTNISKDKTEITRQTFIYQRKFNAICNSDLQIPYCFLVYENSWSLEYIAKCLRDLDVILRLAEVCAANRRIIGNLIVL